MRPLRIRYAGANFQDLIEMTDAEMKTIFAYTILVDFATDVSTNRQGTVAIGNPGGWTSIGAFVDKYRTEAVNSPVAANATGANSTATTTLYQNLVTGTVSITNRAVGLSGTDIYEFTDAQYNTDIMDLFITDYVAQNQVGQYQIKSSGAPAGGTWTSRGTFTDTTDSVSGGTTTTYTLWQKTALASPPSSTDNRPLKYVTGGLQEMTDAEIKQSTMLFRNRIINTATKGMWKLQNAAPGTGTWVQMGDTIQDSIQQNVQVFTNGGWYWNITTAIITTTAADGVATTGTYKLWLRTV